MTGRLSARPLMLAVVITLSGVAAPLVGDDTALARARALLDRVGLVDGHNDLPWTLRETFGSDLSRVDLRRRGATVDTDIPRLREGRVSGQFWSVFIPSGMPNPARTQLEQIELARRMIAAYPDTFLLATSAADFERARRQGRIASFLGMENGQALENSLGALRAFHALGVRYMTLTHGKNNDWADSATDNAVHGGLTAFGREVVREMNRLGMLVDLSHVSPDVMRQVLDLTEAPVLFSHSSARALVDHRRNVPDDVLARMARNGGVVMVTFIPAFVSAETAAWGKGLETSIFNVQTGAEMERLEKEYAATHGPPPLASLAQVADHIEHVARVAGRDHVGIGSDFYGSTEEPSGLEDVSRFPDLFAELVRRGWSDPDLEKLAAGNVLRTLRGAEVAARRLAASRPPSTAVFEWPAADDKPAPLAIAEQGSFAVGGKVVTAPGTFDPIRHGAYNPSDQSSAGQTLRGDHAYVSYQVPVGARPLPLVMWHGHGQSGKTWETTPDGREGFQTIFLRRRFPVYLVDQPRRGRASRSTVPLNLTAAPDEQLWFGIFRIGVWPNLFPSVQFSPKPEALDQFFRQMVPNMGPYDAEVNTAAVSALFDRIGPGILITHSQSGTLGWLTAIKNRNVRAVVSYEPGGNFVFPEGEMPPPVTFANGSPLKPPTVPLADFMRLTTIPIIVYYGDNIPEKPTIQPGPDQWRVFLEMARHWRDAVNRRGGDVTLVHLPEIGIRGNTHFPMSDLNNVAIADHLSKHLAAKKLD